MPRITRKFEFDAGHRIVGHESKCANLHGHRYTAEVTIDSTELDKLGRVIDFGVVKEVIGGWIDNNWDHNMILHPDDPLILEVFQHPIVGVGDRHPIVGDRRNEHVLRLFGKTPFLMPDNNPTAENMAAVLFHVSTQLLHSYGLHVHKIRLYETPNCWAEYGPDSYLGE